MCCLSEASSHFVVFVCTNPDRKPSRKMKRRPSTSSGTELKTSDYRRAVIDCFNGQSLVQQAHLLLPLMLQ